MQVRILFDSCSTINLLRNDVASALALGGEEVHLRLQVAGGNQGTSTKEKMVNFKLHSLDGAFTSDNISAITIKQVVRPLQASKISQEHHHLLGKGLWTLQTGRKKRSTC